jgi:hypothetical protein
MFCLGQIKLMAEWPLQQYAVLAKRTAGMGQAQIDTAEVAMARARKLGEIL